MKPISPDGSSTRSIDDLFRSLTEADVLANFHHLPMEQQDRFIDWIDKARDDEAHWRRIDILVLAMRMGPQATPLAEEQPAPPGAVI